MTLVIKTLENITIYGDVGMTVGKFVLLVALKLVGD